MQSKEACLQASISDTGAVDISVVYAYWPGDIYQEIAEVFSDQLSICEMDHVFRFCPSFAQVEPLIAALREFSFGEVELHEQPARLEGPNYCGKESAQIIVRSASYSYLQSDIGLTNTCPGLLKVYMDEADRAWLGINGATETLRQAYTFHLVRSRLQEHGFSVERVETDVSKGRCFVSLVRSAVATVE